MSYPKLNFLNIVLQEIVGEWRSQLNEWALSGQLLSAASKALVVKEVPETLVNLNKKWMRRDWSVVPSIEFLSSTEIDVHLVHGLHDPNHLHKFRLDCNCESQSILEILTGEFGHYLDSLVNKEDTQGDEVKYLEEYFLKPE